MTDKQIIIDGKQTTKEDFTDNFSIELTNCNINERKQIGSRYFDIILRKEQECETLASQLDFEVQKKECLEQECEELKDELLTTKCMVTTQGMQYGRLYERLDQLKAENEELKNFHINLVGVRECEIKELLKLKQTLAEIKEFCIDHTQLIHDAYPYLNIILEKINEVKDE